MFHVWVGQDCEAVGEETDKRIFMVALRETEREAGIQTQIRWSRFTHDDTGRNDRSLT